MKTNITRRPSLVKQFVCFAAVSIIALHPLPQLAFAGPEGEQVVQGQVTFSRDGDLTVINASNNSIINYQGFGILPQETVQFIQPSELARVLNRVLGPDPSVFAGTLLANGLVYFANPAGVYFRNGAIVDVGGIYAAAGNITNQDFLNNINHFTNLTGSVVNEGIIKGQIVSLIGKMAANRGSIVGDNTIVVIAAGDDIFIGERGSHIMVKIENAASAYAASDEPAVENTGTIFAGRGQVALGAGDMVSLAIRNTGTIRAAEITIQAGQGAVVEVGGTLDASNASSGATGGTVTVLADRVIVTDATIDASGDAGGGTVLIGGDFQGGGDVPTASGTYVDSGSTINADAITEGDGGKVIVWSDQLTGFYGTLSARGGAESGDGGFAEISGAQSLVSRGSVDLSAPNGTVGTVLYDPANIVIIGGTADGDDDEAGASNALLDMVANPDGQILYADAPAAFNIYESEIEGTAASIILQATNSIVTSGDFTADDVAITAGNSLTMTTNNALAEGSGGIDLTLSADGDNLEFVTTGAGSITITTGAAGDSVGMADITVGKLTTGAGGVSITSDGAITVKQDITATGGNVSLTAGAEVSGTGTISGNILTINADDGIDVNTSVTNLNLTNNTSNAIVIDETNDVTIDAITQGANAATTVNSGGAIAVAGAIDNTAGGDVTLTAGTTITGAGLITTPGVLTADSTGAITLNTAVGSLDLWNQSVVGGAITVTEADGVSITNIDQEAPADVTVTTFLGSGGNITVAGAIDSTNTGNVALDADGAIAVNQAITTTGTGDVNLTAETTVAGAGLITTDVLTIVAETGVDVDTSVATVNINNSTSGAIDVNESSDVSIAAITQGANNTTTVTAGGAIAVAGAIDNTAGGNVTLTAGTTVTGAGLISTPDELTANSSGAITLNTAVGSLDLWNQSVVGGAITVTEADGVSITNIDQEAPADVTLTTFLGSGGTITMTGAVSSDAGGNVSLDADGGIVVSQAISTTGTGDVNLTAETIVAGAGLITTDVLTIVAETGVDVDTSVATVDINNSTSGAIDVNETNDVSIAAITQGANNTTTVTAGGAIAVAGAIDNTAGGNVTLAAGTTVTGAGLISTPDLLTIDAATGVDVTTTVGALDIDNALGDIDVDETDDVNINKIAQAGVGNVSVDVTGGSITVLVGQSGITATTGTVALTASLGIAVNDGITTTGGNVNLTANGATITLNDAVATGGGNVSVQAATGVTSAFTGTITTTAAANSGTASGRVDMDVTAPGTIVLVGAVTTTGAPNNAGTGSDGGRVDINTFDGTVAVTDVTASGGAATAGDNSGGNAAPINITSGDDNNNAALDVMLIGVLTASGGAPNGAGTAGTHGTITVTADGALTDVNAAANNVVGGTLVVVAQTGVDTDTAVDILDIQNALNDVNILDNAGDVNIKRVNQTGAGNVRIESSTGNVTVAANESGVVATTGTVTLVANQGVGVDDVITTGGDVTLTATGTNVAGNGMISGDDLVIAAVTGVDVTTTVATLDINNATSGDVDVDESTAVAINNITQGGAGNVSVDTTGGSITVAAPAPGSGVSATAGDIALTATAEVDVNNTITTAGDVTLTSTGADVTSTGLGAITANGLTINAATGVSVTTTVDSLDLENTTSGAITITETDDVAITDIDQGANAPTTVNSGGTISVTGAIASTAGGLVSLQAVTGVTSTPTGTITTTAVGANSGAVDLDVTGAGNIDLAGEIDTSGADNPNVGGNGYSGGLVQIDTANGTLAVADVITSGGDATGAGVANGGSAANINITTANDGGATDHDITSNGTLTALGGGAADAGGSDGADGTVNITAYGAVLDGNGDMKNVEAGTLNIQAETGVNIDTQVVSIDVQNNISGDIDVDEEDDIDITQIEQFGPGTVSVSSLAGTITVLAGGPTVSATTGSVTLTADQDLVVNGGITTTGGAVDLDATDGKLDLTAAIATGGGNVDIDAETGVSSTAGGTITTTAPAANSGTVDIDVDGIGNIELVGPIVTAGANNGAGNGFDGGLVELDTFDGTIALVNVTTTGGNSTSGGTGGDAGNITATTLDSVAGDDTHYITLNGTLFANAGTGGGGNGAAGAVTITADGGLADGNAGANNVEAGTLTVVAITGVDTDTAVSFLDVTNATSGDVHVEDDDSITITQLDQNGPGSVTVITTAAGGGTITVAGTGVEATSGLVTLDAHAAIAVNQTITTTGGNVTLNAGADVTGASVITTPALLTINAVTGVDVTTSVATVDIDNTTSGDVGVNEADGVNINRIVQGGVGNVSVDTTLGDITVVADESGITATTGTVALTANQGVAVNEAITTTGGAVNLTATNTTVALADAIGTGGGAVGIDAATGVISTDAGTITTTAVVDTNTISGTVTIDVTGDGDITLAGTITTTGADNVAGGGSDGGQVDITTNDGTIDVANVITSGGNATAGNNNGGDAAPINVTTADAGDDETHDITLSGSTLTALGGLLSGSGTAGADGTVTLISDGAVVDNNGDNNNVVAGTLIVDAVTGVDVDTAVAIIDIDNTTSGNIDIDDDDDVAINEVDQDGPGTVLVSSAGGSITVAAGQSGVSATTGTVTLDASQAVNVNDTITTTSGNVTLRGGTGVTSTGAGTVTTTAAPNSGTASGAVDIDVTGVGAVALAGAIDTSGAGNNAAAGSAGGAVTVDTFDGAVAVAAIDTSGGDSTGGGGNGGAAGNIDATVHDDGNNETHALAINGNLAAVGGTPDVGGSTGAHGTVTLSNPSGTTTFNANVTAGDVEVTGITGPVVIGANSTLTSFGNDVDFSNATGINGGTAGGQAFEIQTNGADVFLPDAGTGTALGSLIIGAQNINMLSVTTLGSLAAGTTGSQAYTTTATGEVEIGSVLAPDAALTAGAGTSVAANPGSVTFDTNRAAAPTVATIYNQNGAVTIDTDSNFTMNMFDKFTVLGDFAITAPNQAVLGDLNALGNLMVISPDIQALVRDGALVLDSNGVLHLDYGLAFVAGGRIDFVADIIGPPAQRIASPPTRAPGGVGRDPEFVTTKGTNVFGSGAYFVRQYPSHITRPIFFSPGGAVLDLRPVHPTNTNLSVTMPNPLPGESQIGSGAGQVDLAMQDSLQGLGFRSRGATADERRQRLLGWALYEDVPSTRNTLAAGRLSGDPSITDEDYRAVVERLDPAQARMILDAGSDLLRYGPGPVALAIQKTLADYSDAPDVAEFDGKQFAQWLSSRPAEEEPPPVAGPDAQTYLLRLQAFFERVEGIGLTDKELVAVKMASLGDVLAGLRFRRSQLTLDQLEAAAKNVAPKAGVVMPDEPEAVPDEEPEPDDAEKPDTGEAPEPEADWEKLSTEELDKRIKEDAKILTKLETQIRDLKVLLMKEKDVQARAKLWQTLKQTEAGYDRGMEKLRKMVAKLRKDTGR